MCIYIIVYKDMRSLYKIRAFLGKKEYFCISKNLGTVLMRAMNMENIVFIIILLHWVKLTIAMSHIKYVIDSWKWWLFFIYSYRSSFLTLTWEELQLSLWRISIAKTNVLFTMTFLFQTIPFLTIHASFKQW